MEDNGRSQTDYTGTFFSPCQMPRGRPGGRQMPDPRAGIKFQIPHPRDKNVSKCPTNARGGWAPLELTDA